VVNSERVATKDLHQRSGAIVTDPTASASGRARPPSRAAGRACAPADASGAREPTQSRSSRTGAAAAQRACGAEAGRASACSAPGAARRASTRPLAGAERRGRAEAPCRHPAAHRRCGAATARQIDPARLASGERDSLQTVQSFLDKASEALQSQDIQRAFTLADKAYLLAEELTRR